jgi:cytochrome c oxidase subunit 4
MANNHGSSNNSGKKDIASHGGGHFTVPFTTLRNVAVALLLLTFLTVFTAQLHLGWAAAPIAFLIAFIKAMLVMSFFMGLKFDAPLNRLIFGIGFVGLGVLYLFCILDIGFRVLQTNTL